MNTEQVKKLDRDEVLGLADAFQIEEREFIARHDYDYLCALVARELSSL